MGLSVTFVSGVQRCGKTTLLKLVRDHVVAAPVHYLRLTCRDNGCAPPLKLCDPGEKQGFASSQWIIYERERIFEILPDALCAIRREDRHGQVLIEADADPHLRHAFPYDHRVFVMPAPRQLDDVFRTPAQAADAFKQVLNDTTLFASEIFGLFADDSTRDVDSSSEDRPALTDSQMRTFLNSPLGDELASRIQLQPAFHGLTESDVVVINSPAEPIGAVVRQCIERIEFLLARLGRNGHSRTRLFACDLLDTADPRRLALLDALACFLRPDR